MNKKLRELVPWRPAGRISLLSDVAGDPFLKLQHEMNRLFEGFFPEPGPSNKIERLSSFTPKIDVRETETAIVVRAEMPGMTDKDIEVTLNNDCVILRGEKKYEEEHKEGGNVYFESSFGQFHRSIPLPCEIDSDAVDCSMKNGVLNLVLPKCQQEKNASRKVSVRQES